MRFISLTILLSLVFRQSLPAQSNADHPASFAAKVSPFYKYRKDGKPARQLVLYFEEGGLQHKTIIEVDCDSKKEVTVIVPYKPMDSVTLLLPHGVGLKKTIAKIKVTTNGVTLNRLIDVPQRKQWTVYIYPHSHVDIGYTALQEDVLKLQTRNIDVGIDIARKTQNYPVGARFVWNPEATWVVKSYLQTATQKQKTSFIEAVRKGWIKLDAGFANINTSICSDEELMHFFDNSSEIKKITGQPIPSMVQVDVPGAAWGIVSAAAANGVKGFVSFPNYYDMRFAWDHRPFYWMSADGKNKILFIQGSPYGYGYRVKGSKYGLSKLQKFDPDVDRVSTNNPSANFLDPFIFQETEALENKRSPYDIFAMTWSMADNCLIDADLPEAVKKWNQEYAYPKLIIGGTQDILNAFEKKYGDIIPTYKGDFTEFWTDGLGSDARRVGMSRRAKENLVQAETLAALLHKNDKALHDSCRKAWEYLLLSAEHTWGYQNPAEPMAKIVERRKASFFEQAELLSEKIIKQLLQTTEDKTASSFAVVNTLSWPRSGFVTLSAEQSKAGNRVMDDQKQEVAAQRLSTGELIFEVSNIPAFASKLFYVLPGQSKGSGDLQLAGTRVSNSQISIAIDSVSGNIKSLMAKGMAHEFVKPSSAFGLNSFQHVYGVYNGKDTAMKPTTSSNTTFKIKEKGPLLTSIEVISDGEGVEWLKREIRLYKNQPYVECINSLQKIGTRNKEAIHFGFDFNVPEGQVQIDGPLSVFKPEQDQLPSANRNWLAFQRWVDISNKNIGLTWTGIETPVIELGQLSGNVLDGARQWWLWKQNLAPTQTIFSWPITNHWDTNFPLEQGGTISFRYAFLLHKGYDAAVANQFALEQHRPLLIVATRENLLPRPLFTLDNNKIIVSLKGIEGAKSVVATFRSVSENIETTRIKWQTNMPSATYSTSLEEKVALNKADSIKLQPFETVSLKFGLSTNKEIVTKK